MCKKKMKTHRAPRGDRQLVSLWRRAALYDIVERAIHRPHGDHLGVKQKVGQRVVQQKGGVSVSPPMLVEAMPTPNRSLIVLVVGVVRDDANFVKCGWPA